MCHAAAFVVHVFGDVEDLGEQACGGNQVFGLCFGERGQEFCHDFAAVLGFGKDSQCVCHDFVGMGIEHFVERCGHEGGIGGEVGIFFGGVVG